MMADTATPSTTDRRRAYAARLITEPLPAVVIDCRAAEIVAANAGGLSALGLTRAIPLPHALDSAMPAIASLRSMAASGLEAPVQTPLMFWRNGRPVTLPCHVTRADADNADVATHVTIIFQPAFDASDGKASQNVAKPVMLDDDTIADNDDSPPRIIRDDTETFKEIGRRIRESQAARLRHENLVSTTESEPMSSAEADPTDRAALGPHDIAKLAHELKTPLTAIAAAAEIMRDEQLGSMGNNKYLSYAADIHTSAAHALAVIQNMLAVPGSEAGQATNSAAFDLTELATTTVSSLQPLATQRRLVLTLDAELGLTQIRANATAVRQILLNLLTNALKFTPPGGEVRVVTGYLNDGAVFMVVRDTGDGIDEATLAETFDSSPERIIAREGGGRGIGLRLVRRLAAENGAEFEIESMPGKGTIVMLAFAKDLAANAPTASQ